MAGRFTVSQQTEGALFAALAALLSIASLVPVAGLFLLFAAPVPIILAGLRHGTRLAVTSSLTATALLFIVMGPLEAATFFLAAGSVAVLIAALVRRGLTSKRLLVAGFLGTAVFWSLTFSVGRYIVGLNEMEAMSGQMWKVHRTMEGFVKGPAMAPFARDGRGRLRPEMEQSLAMQRTQLKLMMVMLYYPLTMCIMGGFFLFVVQYVVARRLLARFDTTLPPLAPLREWYLKPWAACLLMVPLFLGPTITGAEAFPDPLEHPLYVNLLILSKMTFFVTGLGALSAFLHRRGFSRPPRYMAYGFALLFLGPFVELLGMIDAVAGWRDPAMAAKEGDGAPADATAAENASMREQAQPANS